MGSGGNGLVPSLGVVRAGNSDPEWKAGGGGRGLRGRRIPSGVSNTEQKDLISPEPSLHFKGGHEAPRGNLCSKPQGQFKATRLGIQTSFWCHVLCLSLQSRLFKETQVVSQYI